MAKLTLLEIVQDALTVIDGDNVNTISETVDSEQVLNIAKQVYYEFIGTADWEFLKELRQLTPLADTTKPNFMRIPDNISDITRVRYKHEDDKFHDVEYCDPDEFLDLVLNRDVSETNTIEVDNFNSVGLLIKNNKDPQYWTSFDNHYIVFDSYNTAVDTTMQASNSIIRATRVPTWTADDSFVPDLTDSLFPVYLSSVKEAVFTYIKQQPNAYDSIVSKRSLNRHRHFNGSIDGLNNRTRYPTRKTNYGRR